MKRLIILCGLLAAVSVFAGWLIEGKAVDIADAALPPADTNGWVIIGIQNPPSATNWTWTSDGSVVTLQTYNWGYSTDVVIPDTLDGMPVTGWVAGLFYSSQATSISGGRNIRTIPESSFAYSELISISFPYVTELGAYSFNNCDHLTSISLSSCTKVGIGSFINCSALEYVGAFDEGLPSALFLDAGAFQNCTSLQWIALPSAVSLSYDAFKGDIALTDIFIPNVMTLQNAFQNCEKIATISLPFATSLEGSFKGCSSLNSVYAPSAVSIGDAFYGCTNIVRLSLPKVEKIEIEAFRGCLNLYSLSIPSAYKLSSMCFADCPALRDIYMSKAVTEVYIPDWMPSLLALNSPNSTIIVQNGYDSSWPSVIYDVPVVLAQFRSDWFIGNALGLTNIQAGAIVGLSTQRVSTADNLYGNSSNRLAHAVTNLFLTNQGNSSWLSNIDGNVQLNIVTSSPQLQSVNGATGAVVITAESIGALTNASAFATSSQGSKADTAVQPNRTITINGNEGSLSSNLTFVVEGGGGGEGVTHSQATNIALSVAFPVLTDTGAAPYNTNTLMPDGTKQLQSMTTGEISGSSVSITLAVPSGSVDAGAKTELWITANATTILDISAYVIPSESTTTSPITLAAGKTYIFLVKKSAGTAWWLTSIVGGY
jgi:hypothetical protein